MVRIKRQIVQAAIHNGQVRERDIRGVPLGPDDSARPVAVHQARQGGQIATALQAGHQLDDRGLSLAEDHHVRPVGDQVFREERGMDPSGQYAHLWKLPLDCLDLFAGYGVIGRDH